MNVFLIRTPRPTPALDPYSLAFSSSAAYSPHHFPILRTTFLSLPLLLSLIRRRPQGIRGIIVTSPRAMEAWELALDELNSIEKVELDLCWRECTWFVVGPATRDAVLRVYPGHRSVLGDGTGSGENLGNFIVGQLRHPPSEGEGGVGGRVVNLVGDKARDTIGNILGKEGIEVEKLLVYETCSLEQTFVRDLESVLPPSVFPSTTSTSTPTPTDPAKHDEEEEEDFVCWFVLFSPSGSKAALRLLRQKGLIPPKPPIPTQKIQEGISKISLSSTPSPILSPSPSVPPSPILLSSSSPHPLTTPPIRNDEAGVGRRKIIIKFAVIGPTTRDYLETEERITVLADAKSPDPAELLRAIREADQGLSS